MRFPQASTRRVVPVALAALAAAPAAWGHDADIVYAHLVRAPGTAELDQLVTLTAPTLSLLAPLDRDRDGELTQAELDAGQETLRYGVWEQVPLEAGGARCDRLDTRARLRDTYVELRARWKCPPGELRQTFRILSVLPGGYRVVLGTKVGGAQGQRFAEGSAQTLYIPDSSASGAAPVQGAVADLAGWVRLGVFHIFTGYDHLAFLAGLLLVAASWRRTLWMVTAFTLAHSVTLAAAALGWVRFGPAGERVVEVLIAASIVWVATENLVLKSHRHRAALTFAFGLIHGFGFASVLASYGLGEAVALGLFGFNLGVELGQAAVVLALYPLIRWTKRRPALDVWLVRGGSVAVLAAGSFWLLDRVIG